MLILTVSYWELLALVLATALISEYTLMMDVAPVKRPIVFDYENYREFLRDFFAYKKESSSGFSYRIFSASAGFKSPNFLKLVIENQRNLTKKSIGGIIRGFKLSPEEGSFFGSLVFLLQAKNATEKRHYLHEISRSKVFRELHPMKQAAMEVYQNWYCIPIREIVASPGFRNDPVWIGQQFFPKLTAGQVEEAIQTLVAAGLLRPDGNGSMVQSDRNITTGNEVQSALVSGFHKKMLELAASSLDNTPRYHRDISSATVLVTESTFNQLKELVQKFRKTLIAESEQAASESKDQKHAVYQISFQLFPLTKYGTNEESSKPEDRKCAQNKAS